MATALDTPSEPSSQELLATALRPRGVPTTTRRDWDVPQSRRRAVVPGATCDGSKATRSRQQERDAIGTSLRAVVPGATCDGSGHALRAVVPGASYDGSEGSRESLTMALGASYDGSEGARESSQRLCGSTLSGSRELRTMALRDPGRRQGASYDGMLVTRASTQQFSSSLPWPPGRCICVGLFNL